jgi:type IV pilus assembly protein PilC
MKNFKYTAITTGSKKVNGIISADDLKEAKIALKEKSLRPIEIKETKSKLQGKQLFSKKKLRADVVSHFCRQFRIIIASGVNSIVGLESMASKSKDKIMAQEINTIINSLKTGGSISEVMLNEDSKFPKLLGAMVATGEATGTLEDVLKSMSTFYEREHKITQKIRNASTYPIVIGVTSFVMLFIFTGFIIPQMMDSIVQTGAKLPFITKMIMGFGIIIKKFWYLIIPFIIFLIYQLKLYVKTPIGRKQKDKLITKIPLLGIAINAIVSMRFSRALYLFTSTGYPLLQGLDYIKDSINNSIAEKAIDIAKEGVIKGESVAENLEKIDYFDPIFLQMISIGEQTGQLESISYQMAEFYEHEAQVYLERLVSMIEPIMIIVVGIIAAILVVSVFLPMLSLKYLMD